MNLSMKHLKSSVIATAIAAAFPLTAAAAGDSLESLRADVTKLQQEVKAGSEWKNANTGIHLAGYADVGYIDTENTVGSTTPVSFNPIFHFQYKDLLLLETELAYSIDGDGALETELEYASLNLFVNDYLALGFGKFQSPIGQFRQNGHPSWINKLPSAPVGFGHGGAAPLAEVGIQARGGMPLGGSDNRINYALFIGNGPTLEIDAGEVEMIETNGFGADADGSKVGGGRIGLFVPTYKLDLGLSLASGKVAGMAEPTIKRDYDVVGADFAWRPGQFDVRGEYVAQEAGDAAASAAPQGGEWKAWYGQVAYRIGGTKLEPALRYSRFDTPHPGQNKKQWALGVNYLLSSNVVAKIAHERNEGEVPGAATNDDRTLLQLAYGF